MEGVGRSVGGSDVADSNVEGGGAGGERVGRSVGARDGDDLAAHESGGYGLVEGVGVLVEDGRGVNRVGGGSSRRASAGGRGLAGGRSTGGGNTATSAGRTGARRAVGDARGKAGSTRAGARGGRRDSAADLRALGGSKSGEGADEDSGELHYVDGRDELGVGSIERLMGDGREGGDEQVKRKGRWWARLVVFLKDGPKPVVSLRNWLLVTWGLALSRTALNHLKKPLRHPSTTYACFRPNRASTPLWPFFSVASRRRLPVQVSSSRIRAS